MECRRQLILRQVVFERNGAVLREGEVCRLLTVDNLRGTVNRIRAGVIAFICRADTRVSVNAVFLSEGYLIAMIRSRNRIEIAAFKRQHVVNGTIGGTGRKADFQFRTVNSLRTQCRRIQDNVFNRITG